jgi:hypothetical protein
MCAAIDYQLAKNHVTGCGVGDVMKRLSRAALVVVADSFILIISSEIISLSRRKRFPSFSPLHIGLAHDLRLIRPCSFF